MKKTKIEKAAEKEPAEAGTPNVNAPFEAAARQAGYKAGTVEFEARVHWEREKAGYEQRTGEKVLFEPPFDPGRTKLPAAAVPAETTLGESDE